MDEKIIKSLLDEATKVAHHAYAPYSKFPVGSVILLEDGRRFLGVNIENASYPVTLCAERAAMAPVVTAGLQALIKAVVVVTAFVEIGSPCGICRQFLSEFLTHSTPIICGNSRGDYEISSIAELLPKAFDKSCLMSKGATRGA